MSSPYREPSPPAPAPPALVDVERRHGEYRLVVVSGEPARGDCRHCAHLVGHVTWWCDEPRTRWPWPRRTGECAWWAAPPRAASPTAVASWWRRVLARLLGPAPYGDALEMRRSLDRRMPDTST